MSSSEVWCREI